MRQLSVAAQANDPSPSPARKRMQHAQRGVTLIEVLITVIVLAIGLLGLARLQASGTKFNHSAYLRTQATALAYDMTDRMRANLLETYATALNQGFDSGDGPGCEMPLALGEFSADGDINQWKDCLENTLPVGRGAVTRLTAGNNYTDACGNVHPPAGRDLFVIEVTWDNSRLQNEGGDECVVVRTQTEVGAL